MRATLLVVIWVAAVPARGDPTRHDDVTYPEPERTTACVLQAAHPVTHDDTTYPEAEVVLVGCGPGTGGGSTLAGAYDDVTYPAPQVPLEARKLLVIEREGGFDPSDATVEPGEPVELVLRTEGSTPCPVTVNELGLRTTLQPNAVGRIAFTAPRSGTLTLECVTTGEHAKLIVD